MLFMTMNINNNWKTRFTHQTSAKLIVSGQVHPNPKSTQASQMDSLISYCSLACVGWPIHGNRDVTWTLVFVGGLRHDKPMTKLWQNLVDEKPDVAKYALGATSRPPGHIRLGSHQPSFVEVLTKCCHRFVIVLSKFCRRPPTKPSIKVTSRLPWIGHLTFANLSYKGQFRNLPL